MEIERLPLGQSLADKHRAAKLKWRGKPPGIPPEIAIEFMERLKADGTIRILPTILIRQVRIGRHTIRDVRAGVSPMGEMLAGLSRGQCHRSIHNRHASGGLDFSTSSGSIGRRRDVEKKPPSGGA